MTLVSRRNNPGIDLDMLALESRPLSYVALMGAKRLAAALRRGVTTMRDPSGGDAGLARAIAEGVIAAPRYLWTGPALSQTGGHGDARAADADGAVGGPEKRAIIQKGRIFS